MRKLFAIFIILAAAAAVIYFLSGILLAGATQKALAYLVAEPDALGIRISGPQFQAVRFRSVRSLSWERVSFNVKTAEQGIFATDRTFYLQLGEVTARLEDLPTRSFGLEMRDGRVFFDHLENTSLKPSEEFREKLDIQELKLQVQLDFLNPTKVVAEMAKLRQDLTTLLTEGKSRLLTGFYGASTFEIAGKNFTTVIRMQTEGDASVLVMDREDLRMISKELREELTESEIDLLSRYPVRAPRLLRIRDYAQSAAEEAHRKDSRTPEDAYRHVLWSYLLTRAFGAEFAEKVTDAHEIGDVEGEKDADHRMDYNNNAVGRRYALKGYAESSIRDRVLTDPDVIRSVGLA